MTVEAHRVCGELASVVDGAAVPTHARLLTLEVIDRIIKPLVEGASYGWEVELARLMDRMERKAQDDD